MYIIFMDESGYTPDWKSDIDQQPFYVCSAVCFKSELIPNLYESLRNTVESIKYPGQSKPLGLGFEIKAKDIARGAGWWGEHNDERNIIRDMYLSTPSKFDGVSFIAVIDKKAHLERYHTPADPYILAMTFVLERVEMLLSEFNDHAFCIYDHNKRLEADVTNHAAYLIRDGSQLFYHSRFLDILVIDKFQLRHLIELSLGSSTNSIGLQVADYFATMAYHYYKDGKPSPCGWWDILVSSLHTKSGKLLGVGLKEFP